MRRVPAMIVLWVLFTGCSLAIPTATNSAPYSQTGAEPTRRLGEPWASSPTVSTADMAMATRASEPAVIPTKPELWVLEQVKAGLPASFDPSADAPRRTVRARFIKELLSETNKEWTIQSYGVDIRNAIIDGTLNLSNMMIPHETGLTRCHFAETIDLSYSHFEKRFSISESILEKPVDLSFGRFDKRFSIMKATFGAKASVDGRFAYFGLFDASNAVFKGVESADPEEKLHWSLSLQGAEVKEELLLRDVDFAYPVGLAYLQSNYLWADGARFRPREAGGMSAQFEGMQIATNAWFKAAHFDGQATFVQMHIGADLNLEGATFQGNLYMKGTRIDGQFIATKAEFPTKSALIDLSQVRIEGVAFFDETDFAGTLILTDMTSGGVNGDDEPLELAERAVYSPMVYENVENAYQRQASPERADETYVKSMRRQERERWLNQSLLQWFNPFNYLRLAGVVVLDVMVQHGREPERALFLSVGVILAAWSWLWRHGELMERTESDKQEGSEDASSRKGARTLLHLVKSGEHYNGLWYSIDLFIPGIDLFMADAWRPKYEPTRRSRGWWAWHYFRLHKAAGWVLIPIGLAAVAGLFG